MGQPITVVEKPSSNPAVLRFETNRPLTGMGHERYTEAPSELLDKTGAELARRLFAEGGIEAVHLNGSVVTVTLGRGQTGAGLGDVVRNLFLHYGTQTDSPADETTADAAPVDSPADDSPADETTADAAPVDSPADDSPADETTADAAPVDSPADDSPADAAPVEETADDSPADDSPADPPAADA